MPPVTSDRRHAEATGSREVLDAFRARVAAGMPRGIAAARSLVEHRVGWPAVRDVLMDSDGSVILAEDPDGPILAARHFRPMSRTTIHDHGAAGAALVVEGRDRYERFRRSADDGAAVLESTHDLATGDVMWWNEPPDDLHRQRGLDNGAIELILLAERPDERTDFVDATPSRTSVVSDLVVGYLEGDLARFGARYSADVLVDANVPEWRFQLRGRREAMDLLQHEEFAKPDRRVTFLRATDTAEGVLLETESRFTDDGEPRVCRETHNLRVRDGEVVEHVVWCTGIAFGTTARRQFDTAPMERA